ncbi:MAG: NUDIX domain-containing protein [Alphaproteobacteria bacterium]|nr:NUDIX domain-containing protein [Alphaproteobacteria bacterium]
MMTKKFRRCAGAVVFNIDGNVLLGSRIECNADAWQFPQGGIETGESPEEAAKRELFEETSVSSVKLVYTTETPVRYEFTDEIKQNFRKRGIFNDGQDIYFSLFYFCGQESEINVQTKIPEFKKYIWADFVFAVENVVDFKKEAYLKIKDKFIFEIRRYLDKLS